MPFDPAAFNPAEDPWGFAIAASAGLSVVTTLVSLSPRLRTVGTRLMGLSLVGFLGSSVAGTAAQIQAKHTKAGGVAQAASDDPVVAASTVHEPNESAETSAAPAPADGDEPEDPGGDTPADEGEQPQDPPTDEAAPPAPTDDGASEPAAPPAPRLKPAASKLDPLDPLPADENERATEVRRRLREGKRIASNRKDCLDPKAVGQAWAALDAVPDDFMARKVSIIARRLETCRKKLFWTTKYVVHRDRVAAREAFEQGLDDRLGDDEHSVFASIYGMDHELLRIGVRGPLDQAIAERLFTPALREEAQDLGFARVTVSQGEEDFKFELSPLPEEDYVNLELAPYGLDEPIDGP